MQVTSAQLARSLRPSIPATTAPLTTQPTARPSPPVNSVCPDTIAQTGACQSRRAYVPRAGTAPSDLGHTSQQYWATTPAQHASAQPRPWAACARQARIAQKGRLSPCHVTRASTVNWMSWAQ